MERGDDAGTAPRQPAQEYQDQIQSDFLTARPPMPTSKIDFTLGTHLNTQPLLREAQATLSLHFNQEGDQ